jgi:nitrogen fixation protein NifX
MTKTWIPFPTDKAIAIFKKGGIAVKYKIAVGSRDGKVVNEHFGQCQRFIIIVADEDNASYQYCESRDVTPPCDNGDHSEGSLEAVADSISDCQIVLISKIGVNAELLLKSRGIDVLEYHGLIEDALKRILQYYR